MLCLHGFFSEVVTFSFFWILFYAWTISDSYNPKGPDPLPENEVLVKSDKKMMKDEMKQYRICEIVPNGSVFSGPLIGF